MGGFECATHLRGDRTRIDIVERTRHDLCAEEDYRLLQHAGIRTVRDGLRWHHIEREPGVYVWDSFLPQLRASLATGTQVIWDLCHWGVPSHVDLFTPGFVESFARFAAAAAAVVRAHSDTTPFFCLINEISFWAWVGGDVEAFHPHAVGRGPELKRQLVRASLAARRAVLEIEARARFVQAEPIIHIATDRPENANTASLHTLAQYETWDWLRDGTKAEVEQRIGLPDIIGVNYYWNNQWIHEGDRTPPGHLQHRPLHTMLLEVWHRYRRPVLITETGAEASAAAGWLGYVAAEARLAQRLGAEIVGICLYPIMDYPGWDDERHCSCGLIALDPEWRRRELRPELVAELRLQQAMLAIGA